jgi:hypothetical protein
MAQLQQRNLMARKVELHMDALGIIVLLFAAAVAFIAYQRHQYSDLLKDNLAQQMKQLSLELEVARLEVLLKRATNAGQGK